MRSLCNRVKVKEGQSRLGLKMEKSNILTTIDLILLHPKDKTETRVFISNKQIEVKQNGSESKHKRKNTWSVTLVSYSRPSVQESLSV